MHPRDEIQPLRATGPKLRIGDVLADRLVEDDALQLAVFRHQHDAGRMAVDRASAA